MVVSFGDITVAKVLLLLLLNNIAWLLMLEDTLHGHNLKQPYSEEGKS